MKSVLCSFFMLFACTLSFAQLHPAESPDSYWPGQLLIQLQAGYAVQDLAADMPTLGLTTIKNISPEWNIWQVGFNQTLDANEVKKTVGKSAMVKLVQFNHNNIPLKSAPNDSAYTHQWDMNIISAPQAWDLATGGKTADSQQIVVATVDAGFDLAHPDINFWKNTAEIPNNGIDDDGNGYVDDYKGWNTVLNSDSIPVINHGTFVAGISGARGNNTLGVAGTCWNIKEMVLVTNENNEASVVSAYTYVFKQRKMFDQTAGAKGAFVVATNSSFGPAGYGYNYPLWDAMYDSLGSIGILNAGATSNTASCNTDTCPDIPSQCASNYTVIVTGTTNTDVRHGGYGPHNVDLAAPGNGTYTTLMGSTYGSCGGTSAASPHVAGAIALMWSAACPKMLADYHAHPDSMALVMKNYLLETVDTLPALVGLIVSGGRLNLYKAITKVKAYDCTMPSSVVSPTLLSNEFFIYPNPTKGFVAFQTNATIQKVEVYDLLGKLQKCFDQNSPINLGNLPNGVYLFNIALEGSENSLKRLVVKQD